MDAVEMTWMDHAKFSDVTGRLFDSFILPDPGNSSFCAHLDYHGRYKSIYEGKGRCWYVRLAIRLDLLIYGLQ